MVSLLAAATESSSSSSTPVIVFCILAVLALGSWGWTKYRDHQSEKKSQDLRNLYASVHSERPKA
jgi:hypothetical protein